MLTAILFILKIIGLILLVLLGLVLLLVFLVLLVPVRYWADGSYYEKPKAMAKITWLLHIFSVKVQYETELDICIRIFGLRLKLPEAKEGQETQEDIPVETPVDPEEKKDTCGKKHDRSAEQMTPAEAEPTHPQMEEDISDQLLEDERRAGKKKKKRTGTTSKDGSAIQKIFDKLDMIKEKKDEVMEILHNEEYWETFRLVKRQVFGIVKHVLPKEIQGKVRFGFEDPFKTGQILTYISPFYALYAKHLELTPVFEDEVMEGELWLKGRIRIGTILIKAVRLLFDKNIRKLIRKFRKG